MSNLTDREHSELARKGWDAVSAHLKNHPEDAPLHWRLKSRMGCLHEDRSGDGEGNWVCDHCFAVEPKTEEDMDWQPWNPEHCSICGHSEKFGGPLYTAPGASLILRDVLRHERKCW